MSVAALKLWMPTATAVQTRCRSLHVQSQASITSTPPLRYSLQPPKRWQNWDPWTSIQITFASCFVWRRIRDKKMVQRNLIPSRSTLEISNRQMTPKTRLTMLSACTSCLSLARTSLLLPNTILVWYTSRRLIKLMRLRMASVWDNWGPQRHVVGGPHLQWRN